MATDGIHHHERFQDRHIGPTPLEQETMLAAINVADLDELLREVVPNTIRIDAAPEFPALDPNNEQLEPLTEPQAQAQLAKYMERNGRNKAMLGLGYYGCHTPGPIKRLILESPSWYTAYTPYQAEISQGRLEMLLNFQTMVASLCGLAMANASLLDEATAAAEAMTLLHRAHKSQANRFLVDADTHPQILAVLATRAEPLGIEIIICNNDADFVPEGAFAALLSCPSSSGLVTDRSELIAALELAKVKTAICVDPLALTILKAPGEMGAAVAVGSCQRFGMPMGAGGPHAAFMAFDSKLVRLVPGRLVGIAKDTKGRTALRLALQTREQHIRRGKATSNICTAQVLPAMVAASYAIYHGPAGLRTIAERTHHLASFIAATVTAAGHQVRHDSFFDTVYIRHPQAIEVQSKAAAAGLDLGVSDDWVCVSTDETTTVADVVQVLTALGISAEQYPSLLTLADVKQILQTLANPAIGAKDDLMHIATDMRRTSAILPQLVFTRYHNEHAFIRYLRRLADKDLALDRSMIPLGSCTMKLNATTEMEAITNPAWVDRHPFAPADQLQGLYELADDLAKMLIAITGFDAISLQPNAGAQGEYAGLLAIRSYHTARGEAHRNICLIPDSAHGTNPASAVMVGMEVVQVAIDKNGDIDAADLAAKATTHADNLAALMVTFPSTCGVYSADIQELCTTVHNYGGQVYMDGANLNALVGVALPGKFGPDVMHINLHKTFCIPHGGGGPGMGPIVCKEHLTPHLPGHPMGVPGSKRDGAVSAAPLGSAALLAISWAYMRMMGATGLREATTNAILAANYMACKLAEHYPLAFTGPNNRIAHEFVIDMSDFKQTAGITVEDVAKRLIDMGFHAPTVSFPVPGALMIEPTESEPLEELDRFCEAMLEIREEIRALERSEWDRSSNPLIGSPHVAQDMLASDGPDYDREKACYPLPWVRKNKFWPPVSRIDQVFGDRNLQCVINDTEEI